MLQLLNSNIQLIKCKLNLESRFEMIQTRNYFKKNPKNKNQICVLLTIIFALGKQTEKKK